MFNRTIPLIDYFSNGNPVSRAEARQLNGIMELHKIIQLDFEHIQSIGPSFTHELFVVFPNFHPDVQLEYVNACEEVEAMIRRVQVTERKRKELEAKKQEQA